MSFWKRISRPATLSILFLLVSVAAHSATIVDPSNPNILYTGRMDLSNSSQPNFSWSGTSIIANFQGTSLSATFSSESGNEYLYVIIDDQVDVNNRIILDLSTSQQTFLLASGLTNGTHKVEIVKLTEN